jgi:hypothetical protein
MSAKLPIKELYRRYLKYAKNEEYEKIDDIMEVMEEHKDYETYLPHNEELDEIPDKIVLDYFNYLIKNYGFGGNWHLTLDIVKEGMLSYVKGLPVLDIDLRAIIDGGWDNHALEDSNPRCGIYDEIKSILEVLE